MGRIGAMAGIISIGLAPMAVHAQVAPRGAPTKAQIDSAAHVLRVITSAFQSNEVGQPVKNALFECLYANPVSKVSEATERVIAANAGKVDRKDASQMLAVIAGVCGYRPGPAGPAAKPAPKK